MLMFDNKDYEAEAKERFGETGAYKEYAEKTAGYTKEKWTDVNEGLMEAFGDFAECKKNGYEPCSHEARVCVVNLKGYITRNLYTCTNQILKGLAEMYTSDERFRKNIDKFGEGTAEFVREAIEIYCG